MISICFLSLLRALSILVVYKQLHNEFYYTKALTTKIYCCCKAQLAQLLKDLSGKNCKFEVKLVSGLKYDKIEGFICGLRSNNSILIIIDPKNLTRYYIPIDKIAAICVSRPCK